MDEFIEELRSTRIGMEDSDLLFCKLAKGSEAGGRGQSSKSNRWGHQITAAIHQARAAEIEPLAYWSALISRLRFDFGCIRLVVGST